MSTDETKIDAGHQSTRRGLRALGAVFLCVGILLTAFGAYRMFSPAWTDKPDPTEGFMEGRRSFDEVSRGMDNEFKDSAMTAFSGLAIVAVGMVCTAAGAVMLKFGYMGRVARYAAGEIAPVAADTINYMGASTREGVHDLAKAVASGIRDGAHPSHAVPPSPQPMEVTCPQCRTTNPPGSHFCSQCGSKV